MLYGNTYFWEAGLTWNNYGKWKIFIYNQKHKYIEIQVSIAEKKNKQAILKP